MEPLKKVASYYYLTGDESWMFYLKTSLFKIFVVFCIYYLFIIFYRVPLSNALFHSRSRRIFFYFTHLFPVFEWNFFSQAASRYIIRILFEHDMFSKFLLHEVVGSQSELRSSQRRAYLKAIKEQYPKLDENQLEKIIPKKSLRIAKCPDHINVLISGVTTAPIF